MPIDEADKEGPGRVWKRVTEDRWVIDDIGIVKRIRFGPSEGEWEWALWVVSDNLKEIQQYGREETRDTAMAALKRSYGRMVNPRMPPPYRDKKPIEW